MDTVSPSASRSRASTQRGQLRARDPLGRQVQGPLRLVEGGSGHPLGDVEPQRLRKLHRTDAHLLAIGRDLLDPEQPAGHAERCDREQRRHLRGKRPVPVDRLLADPLQRVVIRGEGDPPVQLEAERFLRHPPRRHERPDRKVDPQLLLFRDRLALELGDRLLEDPAVGVEAHGRDVAVLLRAEQVAGAADLEVSEGDPEPGPERLVSERSSPGARAPPR